MLFRSGDLPLDRPDLFFTETTPLPTKLRLDLGRIDRITAVMTRTILDVTDQAFRLVQRFQDGFNNLQVGPLIMSADVVNLTDASLVENQDWWKHILSGEYSQYFEKMYGDRL